MDKISSKDRYKFKNWTKGYTLAPPNPEGTGDFTIIDKEGNVVKDGDANNPLAKEDPKEGGSKEAVEEEEEEEEVKETEYVLDKKLISLAIFLYSKMGIAYNDIIFLQKNTRKILRKACRLSKNSKY